MRKSVLTSVLVVPIMAQEPSTAILQIFREPLSSGNEAAYKRIEDETARLCVELGCPHPHVALEPLTGPKEVWWLNAFESEAQKQRVDVAYKRNQPLMAALERNSKRKAFFTGTPINIYAYYRPDLSLSEPWTMSGARFVVVAVTKDDLAADGSVFEDRDGTRYILKPVGTQEQAEADARKLGADARVFAVRPYWGLPARDWVDADPEFWESNPLVSPS